MIAFSPSVNIKAIVAAAVAEARKQVKLEDTLANSNITPPADGSFVYDNANPDTVLTVTHQSGIITEATTQ